VEQCANEDADYLTHVALCVAMSLSIYCVFSPHVTSLAAFYICGQIFALDPMYHESQGVCLMAAVGAGA